MMEASQEEVASLKHTTDAHEIQQLEMLSDQQNHQAASDSGSAQRLWQRKWFRAMVLAILALNGLVVVCMMSESVAMSHLKTSASRWFQQLDIASNSQVEAQPTDAAAQPTEEPPKKKKKKCVKLRKSHVDTRFLPDDFCVSRKEMQQILINLVFTASEAFAKANITYWLDSGTLLGSYREHTVIPHDVDADFGIDEASYLRIRDSKDLVQLPPEFFFPVFNSSVHEDGGRDANIPIRVIDTRNGFYVDVFVFLPSINDQDEEMMGPVASVCFGGCERCPKGEEEDTKHFLIPKNWIFPLVDCDFAERKLKCPREAAKYLDFLYGDDFMTPRLRRRLFVASNESKFKHEVSIAG